MASSYAVYFGVSRSKVSYVCSSRLSCSGCKGTCMMTIYASNHRSDLCELHT